MPSFQVLVCLFHPDEYPRLASGRSRFAGDLVAFILLARGLRVTSMGLTSVPWLTNCSVRFSAKPSSKTTFICCYDPAVMENVMATSPATIAVPQRQLEDPLAYLPCSRIIEYRKRQVIYNQDQPSTSIFLVIDGQVKVCRRANDSRQVVVDIYQKDEFFGESALLTASKGVEQAIAIENAKVMDWTASEIEELVVRRPRLAIALLQFLVERELELGHRIESFSVDNSARRLARALIRFSERLGQASQDGGVQVMPFTHELLSQYVGTSREIVTHYMNQFRRQGYLRYSRSGILLYRDALKDWLRRQYRVPSVRGGVPQSFSARRF
jgi:CRP/FNR family cyclic AMP-dependent transcriptional regulator